MFLKAMQSYAPMLFQRAHEKLAEWDQEVMQGMRAAQSPVVELLNEGEVVTIPVGFVPQGQIYSELLKEFEPDATRVLEGIGTSLDTMFSVRTKGQRMSMAIQLLHAKAQQSDSGELTEADAKQAVAIAKAVEKYALADE